MTGSTSGVINCGQDCPVPASQQWQTIAGPSMLGEAGTQWNVGVEPVGQMENFRDDSGKHLSS